MWGVAESVAPEDIHLGDYLTVLYRTYELPSFLWCGDAATMPPEEVVRLRLTGDGTHRGGGQVRRVVAVSLPWVLVEDRRGTLDRWDVRTHTLARVGPAYGELAMRTRRRKESRSKRKSRKE